MLRFHVVARILRLVLCTRLFDETLQYRDGVPLYFSHAVSPVDLSVSSSRRFPQRLSEYD